ncbi:hypothetical protein Hgul01_03634 [Herpetosiphon gulosus]|uniref:Uncharacterized protein n=1 Tax=Herpetosiphon gulosus TaxID=1973496 RepID=A0ABP9X331_9CHLR
MHLIKKVLHLTLCDYYPYLCLSYTQFPPSLQEYETYGRATD